MQPARPGGCSIRVVNSATRGTVFFNDTHRRFPPKYQKYVGPATILQYSVTQLFTQIPILSTYSVNDARTHTLVCSNQHAPNDARCSIVKAGCRCTSLVSWAHAGVHVGWSYTTACCGFTPPQAQSHLRPALCPHPAGPWVVHVYWQ